NLVLTRLHERPLQAIAERTGGTYTPAHTKALPLGELFRKRIDNHASREDGEDDDALPAYRPRSSWFFGAAFCLLVMDMAVGRRRSTGRITRPRWTSTRGPRSGSPIRALCPSTRVPLSIAWAATARRSCISAAARPTPRAHAWPVPSMIWRTAWCAKPRGRIA